MEFITEFSIVLFATMVIVFVMVLILYVSHLLRVRYRKFFWLYGDYIFWSILLSFTVFGGYNFYLKYGEEILNHFK
jgi:hypothetical protein